jgi:hypothetical protein
MRALGSAVSALFVSFLLLGACGGGADGRLRVDAGPGGDDDPDASTECGNPPPTEAECDFFNSCGCNVAGGEKCSIEAVSGDRQCFDFGPKPPGALCADERECEPGSLCAIFGVSGEKHCMKFCDDDHGCPSTPTPQACYVPILNVSDATVCGQVCDLRGQDCAIDGQGCYPSEKVPTREKGICANAAGGEQGDACTLGNDCKAGFICADSDGKCHAICDRQDGDPACATGTCKPLGGHTATGFCG